MPLAQFISADTLPAMKIKQQSNQVIFPASGWALGRAGDKEFGLRLVCYWKMDKIKCHDIHLMLFRVGVYLDSTTFVPKGIITPMQFSILTDLGQLGSLEAEWRTLLSESVSPVPFLDPAYQRRWWQTFGGGEWPSEVSQLQIIIARESDRLVGIAPLFFSEKPGSPAALRFIGSIEVSDYLDFVVRPADLHPFLDGLLAFIQTRQELPSQQLVLDNIRDDSATLIALEAACARSGWVYERSILQPSPYIPLPASWDDYLAGLDKKQRHEIRRKIRNAESNFETAWYIHSSQTGCDGEVEQFIRMMRNEADKDAFLTAPMTDFMRSAAEFACSQGMLHLSFLTMNSEQAAAFLSFINGERLLVYNSAFNPDFFSFSPGWVLLAKIIHWAIENGFHEVDMMRGNEVYKYRFGGIDRHVYRVNCQPAGANVA